MAILAALVAIGQLRVIRAPAHGAMANETINVLFSDVHREARRAVWELESKPLGDWSQTERTAADTVANHMTQIGYLVKHGYASRREIIALWGDRYVRPYKILGRYIEAQRRAWSSPSHWIYFVWLARYSRDHEKLRPWWHRRPWQRLQERTSSLSAPERAPVQPGRTDKHLEARPA